jgi:hypothetical protein
MTASSPLFSSPGDRLVALGSLAVRPLVYCGAGKDGPFPPPQEPIEGLSVRSTSARRDARIHTTTNLYGFVNLKPGPHRVHIVDPRGRFLPRAIAVNVPDYASLRDALERRAQTLPAVAPPPIEVAWLRRAPGTPTTTGLFGVVRDATGASVPFAWIRVEKVLAFDDAADGEGRFVTYADQRGEYVVPLSFVRRPSGDDSAPASIKVRVHRPLGPAPAGDGALAAFPVSFDDLAPEKPGFDSVYEPIALVADKAVDFEVGTSMRLDLQPP